MKYILELSEKQAEIIKVALEEYFRLRMNQWFDFATEISLDGYEYDESDPDNNKKFDAYIERRDASQEAFREAFRIAHPSSKCKTDEVIIAQDIWQVMRHQLFLDRGGDPNSYVVDARKPMRMSDEDLPVMKAAE